MPLSLPLAADNIFADTIYCRCHDTPFRHYAIATFLRFAVISLMPITAITPFDYHAAVILRHDAFALPLSSFLRFFDIEMLMPHVIFFITP